MSDVTEDTPTGDAFEMEDLPQSAQDYIKELRDEAATGRVTHKPYKDAYQNYTPEEREYMLKLNALAVGGAEDQAQAAKEYLRLSNALGGDVPTKEDTKAEIVVPEEKSETDVTAPGLTDADVDDRVTKRIDEFARKQEVNRRVAEIKREANELGYEDDSADYQLLMAVAQRETDGDIKAAHKNIEERNQALIDDFVKKQTDKGARFPTQSRQSASPPNGGNTPDWVGDDKATDRAVKEWLSANSGDS
eukprot:GHVR01169826.1.p1 GENE.GHVR01169826.1~~GHVR01169826.1.p1  ORF type:complete len:248 (+),score=60.86 GHVR01169826.1:578-1321(+)